MVYYVQVSIVVLIIETHWVYFRVFESRLALNWYIFNHNPFRFLLRFVSFCLFRLVLYRSVLFCTVPFCSVPFRSVSFCSVPFRSVLVPFRSVPFRSRSVPFRSVPFRSRSVPIQIRIFWFWFVPFQFRSVSFRFRRNMSKKLQCDSFRFSSVLFRSVPFH